MMAVGKALGVTGVDPVALETSSRQRSPILVGPAGPVPDVVVSRGQHRASHAEHLQPFGKIPGQNADRIEMLHRYHSLSPQSMAVCSLLAAPWVVAPPENSVRVDTAGLVTKPPIRS